MEKSQIAKLIDHTLLKPDATREQIVRLAEEAKNMILRPYASIRFGFRRSVKF